MAHREAADSLSGNIIKFANTKSRIDKGQILGEKKKHTISSSALGSRRISIVHLHNRQQPNSENLTFTIQIKSMCQELLSCTKIKSISEFPRIISLGNRNNTKEKYTVHSKQIRRKNSKTNNFHK